MNPLKCILLAALAASPILRAGMTYCMTSTPPEYAATLPLPEKDPGTQDREPSFQGKGVDEFRLWAALHTLYPHDAYEAGTKGSVHVSFTVETDGTLSEIEVMDSPDRSLSEAVMQTLEKSPAWEPAVENGKAVRRELEAWIPFFFIAPYNPLSPLLRHAQYEIHIGWIAPRFHEGDHNTFREWALYRVTYPKVAHEKGIKGQAIVTFTILKDGSMGPVKVVSFSHWSLAAEAARIVQSSPRWEPATKDGIPVNYSYTLPFHFDLQEGILLKEEDCRTNSLAIPYDTNP